MRQLIEEIVIRREGGVLMACVSGALTSDIAQQLNDAMYCYARRGHPRAALIDLTRVTATDEMAINRLLNLSTALKLLGTASLVVANRLVESAGARSPFDLGRLPLARDVDSAMRTLRAA